MHVHGLRTHKIARRTLRFFCELVDHLMKLFMFGGPTRRMAMHGQISILDPGREYGYMHNTPITPLGVGLPGQSASGWLTILFGKYQDRMWDW